MSGRKGKWQAFVENTCKSPMCLGTYGSEKDGTISGSEDSMQWIVIYATWPLEAVNKTKHVYSKQVWCVWYFKIFEYFLIVWSVQSEIHYTKIYWIVDLQYVYDLLLHSSGAVFFFFNAMTFKQNLTPLDQSIYTVAHQQTDLIIFETGLVLIQLQVCTTWYMVSVFGKWVPAFTKRTGS